jgi:hypothetical protein
MEVVAVTLPFEIGTEDADQLRRVIYEGQGIAVITSTYAGKPVTVSVVIGEADPKPHQSLLPEGIRDTSRSFSLAASRVQPARVGTVPSRK